MRWRDGTENLHGEMAMLNARIARLPSKGYMAKIAMSSVAFLTAVIVFADRFKAMIH
ncbi:hypothetical protein [Novosphingobium humi]|uniref:Uncharacterized protein n=1 Tax=Novosphingobium humi TaxID=2282397 RepID=A0ABY7TZF7_9SPHN|nr:hypothetical protein [Novosphingobium humi]WCT78643.1 hypothetical protein PQ457_06685 [Novosphingobium humi]